MRAKPPLHAPQGAITAVYRHLREKNAFVSTLAASANPHLDKNPFSDSLVRLKMSPLAKQCRNKAEEGGFASLMNDTKWRELCFAFAALEKKPAWRARDLLNGHVSHWDSEWFHHIGPDYCSIEWLEIDPRECAKEEIRGILKEVGAPFDEATYFKVLGYKK